MAANWTGGNYHLTVVTPVRPGAEPSLRAALASLPVGPDSPLAVTGTVHFGRWVVIGDLAGRLGRRAVPAGLRGDVLVFAVVVDGGPGPFLERLVAGARPVVDRIWSHCVGYPTGAGAAGAAEAAEVAGWLQRHAVDNTLCFATSPGPTVARIRRALDLRARVIDFAVATQGWEAPALHEAFVRTFP